MSQDHERIVSLQLTVRMSFLPVATHCVETVAKAFGLGREESLKLGLATEEIFSYLCSHVFWGEILDIHCLNGLSYVRDETGHIRRTRDLVRESKAFLSVEMAALGLPVIVGERNYMIVKLAGSDTLAYRKLMHEGIMIRP